MKKTVLICGQPSSYSIEEIKEAFEWADSPEMTDEILKQVSGPDGIVDMIKVIDYWATNIKPNFSMDDIEEAFKWFAELGELEKNSLSDTWGGKTNLLIKYWIAEIKPTLEIHYETRNLNELIFVQITEKGKKNLIKDVGQKYWDSCIENKKITIEGTEYYKLLMHEVMNYFGDMVHSGIISNYLISKGYRKKVVE